MLRSSIRPPTVRALWRQFRNSVRAQIMFTLALAIALFALAFSIGLLLHGNQREAQGPYIEGVANGQDGLIFLGHVYNIDIDARQVQISWLIIGCGAFKWTGTTTYGSSQCGRLNTAANFFVDGASQPNASYDPASNPVYINSDDPVYVQALYEFQTTHLLQLYSWHGLDQQFAYPFDTYQFDTTMTVSTSADNSSLPILGLHVIDSTNNFSPRDVLEIATQTHNSTGALVPSRTASVMFARTRFTKAFVLTLLIVNWALTAVVVWITVSAFTGVKVDVSILVLPLSVVLTIPALRAMWVGAPAFGLLADSCGLFLQMVIVSLCSIALVMSILYQQKQAVKAQNALDRQADAEAQLLYQGELDDEKDEKTLTTSKVYEV